ncbi:MAG: 2-amino-4-hydroxy-6-hydroxymethyldihydropteridine diphosphokinase [Coriobacteriia bacterium]|nr:2-amino-4-hydroxy-6-hydroxymethyldihydropteridine diphosphokinase [Coriobacteriia bacterium]
MTTAYIGIGSNEGDRLANLALALGALADLPDTHVRAASLAYETEPAYHMDQREFANAVVELDTRLEPEQLLRHLNAVEDEMGRVRTIENGPRVIDLDILTFGDEEISTPDLTIPHPHLLERDFVVTPLLAIAPRLHLPDGTRVTHDGATIGLIVDELGPIPDLGRFVNEPVLAPDWVPVAESARENDVVAGWDAHLMFQREALEEAGIPFAWDPYEPETSMDPFGLPARFQLLVPVADVARASRLLAELETAEVVYPEEFAGEEAE